MIALYQPCSTAKSEAQRALTELRSAGVNQDAISIIGRHGEQSSASGTVDGDDDGVNGSGAAKGAVGGAVGGALLGIAALAIPGVGPLAAAGAIASSAIPGALPLAPVPEPSLAALPDCSPTTV